MKIMKLLKCEYNTPNGTRMGYIREWEWYDHEGDLKAEVMIEDAETGESIIRDSENIKIFNGLRLLKRDLSAGFTPSGRRRRPGVVPGSINAMLKDMPVAKPIADPALAKQYADELNHELDWDK